MPKGVTAKDLILAIIGKFGVESGRVILWNIQVKPFALSMEERITVCNMAIEAGARAGLISPDEITFAYLKGRKYAPKGEAYEQAVMSWRSLASDEGASTIKL